MRERERPKEVRATIKRHEQMRKTGKESIYKRSKKELVNMRKRKTDKRKKS